MGRHRYDVAVIGGGIAGVSAACHLADTHSVVLLEQEAELAYHTTSRSAAVYVQTHGGYVFERLSVASQSFLEDPPGADAAILAPLPMLSLLGHDTDNAAAEVAAAREIAPSVHLVEGPDLLDLCPILRPEKVSVGILEPDAASIDVMALHQLYLRTAQRAGAEVTRSARVTGISRNSDAWLLETVAGPIEAGSIVNAAGAWGDVVAAMAGAVPVGLTPLRRTAFTSPIATDPSGWPFVHSDIPGATCYFKPEAGNQLLCSLADETPSEPCDAKAEEIDVAMAIHRINELTTAGLRSVKTSWAGLRTFAPDRNPVFGWDDSVEGFLWLVGQGGIGVISSPAAGQIAAALIRDEPLPEAMTALGLTKAMLAPRRTPSSALDL